MVPSFLRKHILTAERLLFTLRNRKFGKSITRKGVTEQQQSQTSQVEEELVKSPPGFRFQYLPLPDQSKTSLSDIDVKADVSGSSFFSFVDLKDPFSPSEIAGEDLLGPILSLVGARKFDILFLFHTPHTRNNALAAASACMSCRSQIPKTIRW
jgi:hypothetical protein